MKLLKWVSLATILGALAYSAFGCSYGHYTVNERGSYPNQTNTCEKGKV